MRVSSPADLVELVPFLVGFHPRKSLVFVGLKGPRERVGLTLRLDLEAARAAPSSVQACVAHLVRADAEAAVLVVYDNPPAFWYDDGWPALPQTELVAEVVDSLNARGIAIADALLVAQGRWWSYVCANLQCCDPSGHELGSGQGTSVVAAAATVAGMTVAAGREELAAGLAPLPIAERQSLLTTVHKLVDARGSHNADPIERRALAARSWSAAVAQQRRGETVIDEDAAAALLIDLMDVHVRDACCEWALGPDSLAAQALARQLARRATAPWDVAPYALVAWFAWRNGEGAHSRIATEYALASDPNCTFARLIEELLDQGVDPRAWRDPPRMGGGGGPRRSRRRGG